MKIRETLLNALVALACLSSIVTAAVVAKRETSPAAPRTAAAPGSPALPTPVENWKDFLADGHRVGPHDASLTVVEFADFECPACRGLFQSFERLRADYPEDFAIVYRHLPLPYHARAYPAARASECAAAQGKFEAYYRELFTGFDSIATLSFTAAARRAGVADIDQFTACVENAEPVPSIDRDFALAKDSLGARGTPTVLVNGMLYTPAPPEGDLRRMIEAARDGRQ